MALSQTVPSSLQLSLYSNQLADLLLSSAEEKPCLLYWSSLQAIAAYASSVIRSIASAVHAGILDWSSADAPDWVSAEAPSVEEPMD